MKKLRLAIYSCEGFGREILPIAKTLKDHDIVFVDDDVRWHNVSVNGIACISYADLCSEEHYDRKIIIAIANSYVREKIVKKCTDDHFQFFSLYSETFRRQEEIIIDEGAIFCDFTIVLSNAKIGKHFHCNIYSYIAHDCVIGDYVTFAPRVNCNGRIHIGDFAYIGTGATFKQGVQEKPLRVGEGSIIGMGAVVTKDVEPYTIVVGNPATVLKRIDRPLSHIA